MRARRVHCLCTLLAMLEAWNAIDDPAAVEALIVIGWADKRGRTGRENVDYPAAGVLRSAAAVLASLGSVPAEETRVRRLEALARWRRARLASAPATREEEARPAAGSPT